MPKKLEVEDEEARESRICQSIVYYKLIIHLLPTADLLSKLNSTSRPQQTPQQFELGSGSRPTIQAVDPPTDGMSISSVNYALARSSPDTIRYKFSLAYRLSYLSSKHPTPISCVEHARILKVSISRIFLSVLNRMLRWCVLAHQMFEDVWLTVS